VFAELREYVGDGIFGAYLVAHVFLEPVEPDEVEAVAAIVFHLQLL
jgi:hypothetical protein